MRQGAAGHGMAWCGKVGHGKVRFLTRPLFLLVGFGFVMRMLMDKRRNKLYATFFLSMTVPTVQTVELLPGSKIHIYDNTGGPIDPSIVLNGIAYTMENCNLAPVPKQVINVTCDLVEVP